MYNQDSAIAMQNLQMRQMQRMNGMNGMMGMQGIGLMKNNSIINGIFYFTGTAMEAQVRIESLTAQELSLIRDAQIKITGNQVKAENNCCLIATLITGVCLILPFCLICCDWWKRMVSAAYDIPISVYASLQLLLKSPIKNINLTVKDNRLNSQKANLLYNILSQSSLKGFTFINQASPTNYLDSEYSDFSIYMSPIKKINHINSSLQWQTQIVV